MATTESKAYNRTSAAGDVASPLTTLSGWSAKETSGSASASILLRNGSGGTVLQYINLTASETAGEQLTWPIAYDAATEAVLSNVYIDFVSGTCEVTIHGR